jgi:DNA gyrase subunit A
MRYTEARMATIAQEILADIDKETVDFVPNFDDTLTEPSVLPAVLPNLLINGASGIAVGMTTSIPPHNLDEVCDALIYLIDNYGKREDITVEDLTGFVRGPDFPTGGVVYRYSGQDGNGEQTDLIRNAYALGRGRFTVQAQVYIEEMSRNRSRIVVTELPYQVNKTRLIERIAALVRDGKLEGITDLRDESDRQGMRICIELTRTVDAREVLSQLFKLTPMQQTFSLAMLALVDGEPRLLPLKRVLLHYLDHREQIITRRSRHLLERAKHRAHILEGLLQALDHIDEVIDTIRRSRTAETARDNLMKRFDLSEIQAQAILDMPLRRLAALERRKIADEHKEKLQEIKYLQGLLRSPIKIRAVIREDLVALKVKYGDARRTRIVELEKGHHTARDLVQEEDVLLTLWRDGQVSRTGTAPRVSSKALPLAQVWGNTRDDVAFFTTSGIAALIPVHQVPDGQDTAVGNLIDLDSSEMLSSALILPHGSDGEEQIETYLTLVTRQGRIKRVTLEDFSAVSRDAMTVMNVEEGDQLAWVALTDGSSELLLVTRKGRAIRFSERDVRPMGLSAAGVLAVKLGADDAVVGMGVVRAGAFVITMTEQGYVKRTAAKSFPVQRRYGAGVQAVKLSTRTGPVMVAALAMERDSVVLVAAKGRVTKLPVKGIHAMGRAALGYRSRQDTKDPYVDPVKHGPPDLLTVLAATKPAAKKASTKASGSTETASSKKAAKSTSAKKTLTKRTRSTKSTSTTQIKASGSNKETADEEKPGTITQMPLPMQSAPSKSSPSKSRRKGTTRKKQTVRSVPKS